MTTPALKIGIAGAGLAGRLCAFYLSRAGHSVTVFEQSDSAVPGLGSLRAAGWTSAGMLSPIAEMETGGAAVRDLGWRSLQLWQHIQSITDIGLQLHDSLMVCHAQDIHSAQRVLRLLETDSGQTIELGAADVVSLAPELKGTLRAWRLLGEGHLHPPLAMQALASAAEHVNWKFNAAVTKVSAHKITVAQTGTKTAAQNAAQTVAQNASTNTAEYTFDWVIDCRGTGAEQDLPVRGVRGEVIVLSAPGFVLNRPVRLLHPRWRVYIVPRPNDQIFIGATEIESNDRSPISVQSTMELLSAAFSIFPSLAEARVLYSDVNLRPATPDNLPMITTAPGLIRINGLFRHGWLLGPAVVESALNQAGIYLGPDLGLHLDPNMANESLAQ